jgi:hypothetical protein
MFIDCRQIAHLGGATTNEVNPAGCSDAAGQLLDVPLETVYLFSAYDHSENVPVAPIYLMKESSFKDALARILTRFGISEFGEICIFQCDRILNLAGVSS